MTDIKNEREQLGQLEALIRDNQLDRALELGKEISEAYPDSFQVQFAFAGVLRRVDELDRARELLTDLQRRFPGNINLLLALAEIHRRSGDTAAAAEHYNKVLFFDPFNQAAKDALTALGVSAAPKPPPPAVAVPSRLEVDPDSGETAPDFEIRLEDIHPDEEPVPEEVLPDETDTFNLDEAGIPVPALDETRDSEDVLEFGLPMELREGDETVEQSATEVLRVPEQKPLEDPLPDIEDTAPIVIQTPPTPEPEPEPEPEMAPAAEPAPAAEASGDEGVDFYTRSAADLYMAQGLYDEAAEIFRELYRRGGEAVYAGLLKKAEMKKRNRAKINRLKKILASLRENGGSFVS